LIFSRLEKAEQEIDEIKKDSIAESFFALAIRLFVYLYFLVNPLTSP
jgi:hypothetical protein